MSEYLSLQGSNAYVYDSYSGCGERFQFSLGDALRLSYSMANGADPFERIAGGSHEKESFFDAEYESAFGDLGRIGYAASLHSAIVDGTADRVTGSRLWFSSADRRLVLSSEMAVSASETKGRIGTAQRHQISLRVLESTIGSLSTALSFSSVDRDFKGRRSAATPDRQAVGATVTLQSGSGALSLTLRRAHDNLDRDRGRATHLWRTIAAEGSYWLGPRLALPDQLRIYANHTDERAFVRGSDGPDGPKKATNAYGFTMDWTDWLDRSAVLEADAVTFSTNLFADWTVTENADPRRFATGGNAHLSFDLGRLLAVPGHIGTDARIAASDSLDDGFGWQWNLSAELDCLSLLFDTPSTRAAYLLGRFGSGIGDPAAGLNIDYRGMLAGGIRF